MASTAMTRCHHSKVGDASASGRAEVMAGSYARRCEPSKRASRNQGSGTAGRRAFETPMASRTREDRPPVHDTRVGVEVDECGRREVPALVGLQLLLTRAGGDAGARTRVREAAGRNEVEFGS